MVIRRGRSEAADKIFTYVALAIGAVIIVVVVRYAWLQLGPTVGLMTEETILETDIELKPGEARRFSKLEVKPLGRSRIKYRLELDPVRGEIYAGVVRTTSPEAKLLPGNIIYGGGSYVLTTVQGRPRHIAWDITPGKYDVVVENRAQSLAVTKVILKIIYDK